jgi:membrane protease YdiL (CAAX protease family)
MVGLALVTAGFALASRVRPLPRKALEIGAVRMTVLAVAVGVALGMANLLANLSLAMVDASIRAMLVDRFATLSPWGSILAAPVVEEIAMRLVLMSAVAWIAARFTKDPQTVFLVALWLTALAFGLMHIFRPMPDRSPFDLIYAAGVVLKSGLASLVLGWVYWRLGLPYAIVCHSLTNATHRLLAPLVF